MLPTVFSVAGTSQLTWSTNPGMRGGACAMMLCTPTVKATSATCCSAELRIMAVAAFLRSFSFLRAFSSSSLQNDSLTLFLAHSHPHSLTRLDSSNNNFRSGFLPPPFSPKLQAMGFDHLLSPIQVGDVQLKHRVVMSAMTRTRNDPITEAPRDLNVLYYSQRTTNGGLIISEGVAPTAHGRGYIRAPGVYTEAHMEGWKKVTAEVHRKGGLLFCQLMHAGRVTHSSLLPDSHLPVAPSAVKMAGLVHVATGKVPYEEPRPLEKEELPEIVAQFVTAAKNAIACGFDGIELHGGNGYLLQEFMAKKTNLRTDEYGGSVENRARFVLEVVDACVDAIGAGKVGIKLQQGLTFSDLTEPEDDVIAQYEYLGPQLEQRKLAYVCLSSLNSEPYSSMMQLSKPNLSVDPFRYFRKCYKGTLMINGGLSPEQGEEYVADGTADIVAYGALFVANANLPELIAAELPVDHQSAWQAIGLWYGKNPEADAKGYTDWPLVDAVVSAVKSVAASVKETVVPA